MWLAKSTLDYNDSCEVMKRWVDHLCSTQVNQKVNNSSTIKVLKIGTHKIITVIVLKLDSLVLHCSE